jgi:hypothetical protein
MWIGFIWLRMDPVFALREVWGISEVSLNVEGLCCLHLSFMPKLTLSRNIKQRASSHFGRLSFWKDPSIPLGSEAALGVIGKKISLDRTGIKLRSSSR